MTNATWNLTFATWALVFTAIIGIVVTCIQLHIDRRWRRGEHLAKFRELFEGEGFCRLRRNLAKGRLSQIKGGIQLSYENAPAATWRLLDFIEVICREVDQRRLSLEDVWSEYSEWIYLYQFDFAPVIVELRRVRNDDTYYTSLDSIRKKLDEFCDAKKVARVQFSLKDVQDFYEVDAEN